MGGVDALTGTYQLPCPERGTAVVRLSAFREIDRLPGPAHPSLYRVVFLCGCGEEHVALVAHDALDWPLLGLDDDLTFVNLMTARRDDLASELAALASGHIQRGEWPWCFFCSREEAARPVTPSAFRRLAPATDGVAVAVRCPVCEITSINLVSSPHLDVPFHSDRCVGVATDEVDDAVLRTADSFRAQLAATTFDERRLLPR